MKKYILRINDEDIGVIYGDEYEFVDDMMMIYLDSYFVGAFKIYIDGVSIIQSEVENE